MIYVVTINNKKYEVEVERGKAAIVSIKDAAPVVPVAPAAPAPSAVSGTTQAAPEVTSNAATGSVNGEAVKAPMPGTILDVKVNAGTSVKKGDILFILEAMKMENEVVAPKDGTVSEIRTTKGASVSTGDILAVLQ